MPPRELQIENSKNPEQQFRIDCGTVAARENNRIVCGTVAVLQLPHRIGMLCGTVAAQLCGGIATVLLPYNFIAVSRKMRQKPFPALCQNAPERTPVQNYNTSSVDFCCLGTVPSISGTVAILQKSHFLHSLLTIVNL